MNMHYAEFGITSDELNKLIGILGPDWTAALAAHVAARATAKGAKSAKNGARKAVEAYIKFLVARINGSANITDAIRDALGLKPPTPATSGSDIGTSDDRPMAIIDVSNRMKHVMRIQNQTSTGTKRAKPANAFGCEIWRKVGMAPSGVEDMEYVDVVTRSPFAIKYTDVDAGKQAYYAMRWVGSKGEKGNWSETESATIAA